MTDERIDQDDRPALTDEDPVDDDRIDTLVQELRSDAADADVRVDVTEASEQIGTGSDR